jgi:transposase-like protein
VPGKSRNFTPEFKEQAVKMVVSSSPPRPIAHVAHELGINDTTLGFWVKAYREKHAADPLPQNMPDDERVKELERRVRELEMENAFLKKAAAYFAREHR